MQDTLTNGDVHAESNQDLSKHANGGDGDVSMNFTATSIETDRNEEAPAAGPASPAVELVLDADGDVGMTTSEIQAPPSPIFTLTNGQSVGVQIAPPKAADLTPDATILDVAGDNHVTNTAWRPQDPFLVAASGDKFCGMWKLSGQRLSTVASYETLVEGVNVTALDWGPGGRMLALATYADFMGTVTMYNQQGAVVDVLPSMPGLISGLRWASKGRWLVLVVSDGRQSELLVWDQESRPDSFPPSQTIDGAIYEIVWSGDDEVFAFGDGAVYKCRLNDRLELSQTLRWAESSDDEPWTLATATSSTETSVVAAASSSATKVWIPSHDMRIESAHHGDITSLEFRPQTKSTFISKNTFVLATSSMDETVKLWRLDLDSKQVNCIHRLFLGASLPALKATFSPDGYAIAAATCKKLFIWNAERGGLPIAIWSDMGDDMENGDKEDSPSTNGSQYSLAFDRPLSWDSDGKKLALGFGKKVCSPSINFIDVNQLINGVF